MTNQYGNILAILIFILYWMSMYIQTFTFHELRLKSIWQESCHIDFNLNFTHGNG